MKKLVGVIAVCGLICCSIATCAAEEEGMGPNPSEQAIEKANEHAAFKRGEGAEQAKKAQKEAELAKKKAAHEAAKAKKEAGKAAKKAQKKLKL